MDKKYLLFDLDGTLTDPEEGITNSVAYALRQYGIIEDPKNLTNFIGPPLHIGMRDFYGFDEKKAFEAVAHYRTYFADKGIFQNRVFDGVANMLDTLRKAGKTIILATSKPEIYARQILDHFDLTRYFDHICGATMDGTISLKTDVITYALKTAGITDSLKDQAVMIGDRHHDIEGGIQNGIETVGVLFGFGSRAELKEAGAHHIVSTISELLDLLKGESPMKPESSVIFFPCKDIEETKAYYTEVLGLPIYKDLGNTVWFDCGYGYLAFVYYGPDRALATGQCISFNLPSIADVDRMYETIQTRPVIGLKGAPQHHPRFPVYSFFFSDPNGYTLEYQKTTD